VLLRRTAHRSRQARRYTRAAGIALAGALVAALSACGSGTTPNDQRSSASVPKYVTEPFTQEQRLVEQGAPLIVSDGCASCHLAPSARAIAPSFSSFAGHRVRLADGRSVLVDERFVREGLHDPSANEIEGYDPAAMLAAVKRAHLESHPQQVAALAAFIEQVGPEAE
jgi:hypothetical protein